MLNYLFLNTYFVEKQVVTPSGFEPLAYRLGICRSIRLSYGAVAVM